MAPHLCGDCDVSRGRGLKIGGGLRPRGAHRPPGAVQATKMYRPQVVGYREKRSISAEGGLGAARATTKNRPTNTPTLPPPLPPLRTLQSIQWLHQQQHQGGLGQRQSGPRQGQRPYQQPCSAGLFSLSLTFQIFFQVNFGKAN